MRNVSDSKNIRAAKARWKGATLTNSNISHLFIISSAMTGLGSSSSDCNKVVPEGDGLIDVESSPPGSLEEAWQVEWCCCEVSEYDEEAVILVVVVVVVVAAEVNHNASSEIKINSWDFEIKRFKFIDKDFSNDNNSSSDKLPTKFEWDELKCVEW